MHTIKDVAAVAGVSVATVSNYLNQTKPVSPRTEQKIKAAISQLNYTPNLFAKSLKSNKYSDVGIILPSLNDSYYAQIFQGIEFAFQNSNFFLNLAFSYDIPEVERNIVNNFLKKNICGLILVSCMPDDWRYFYDRFTSQDRPLVLIDRLIENLDTIFVTFDNRKTMRSLTLQLLQSGKANIYLFTGPKSFYCENECVLGYLDAFAQMSVPVEKSKIISHALNKENAFGQTINVLKESRPDAIITTSELSAMGIIEALTLLGLTESDVPVYTLGEEHWNRYTHSFATVSTIRPAIQLGETAAKTLMDQIHSPRTYEKRHIILNDHIADAPMSAQSAEAVFAKKEISREIKILMLETPQTKAIQGFLPNFENSTGIKANIEILSQRYLFDRIIAESAADENAADIYMFDIPWLYYLASSGILADISEYIRDSSFDESIFLPDCLKYFSEFENRYYALPFLYGPQIFYYRKDLFENPALQSEYQRQYHSRLTPPHTWKEFAAIAEFFTRCKLDENPVSYGTTIPTAYKGCMVPEIYMRLWAYGGKVYNKHFGVAFDSPQTLKAYINYKSTFKFAKPDYKTATDISAVHDFVNGETAMVITYPSFLADSVDLRSVSLTGSIGYSHIPGRSPILGGWSLGIRARSQKKNDAFAFLKWATTEENANYFTLLGGQPAVSSIFTNDELVTLYPWLPLYRSAYNHTLPVIPPHKRGHAIISQERIDSIICEHAMGLIDDKLDVATTIQKTHADLQELFRTYGY